MKRLWSGNDPVLLTLLRSELEAQGIRFTVKNEDLRSAMGDIPAQDIWPEIWIMDTDRFQEAEQLLTDLTISNNKT